MSSATFAPASRKQQMVLESDAQILVIGGAAGSGKSYLLQLMPLLIVDDPRTACIMFRRTVPQIRGQGGLFDKAKDIYNQLPPEYKPKFKENEMIATFPNGATVKWQSMQHEVDKFNIQGLEFTFIGVDEGTQFTWPQLEYMMSRLRSNSRHPSRMVISCNPDPDHELRKMIDWYLDDKGYPNPDKDGVIRWFVRIDDQYKWGDSKKELIEKYERPGGKKVRPVSFSFISSTIKDNPPMMINNPDYLSQLEGLNEVDRARLLYGNWDARPEGANYFKRSFLKEVDVIPLNCTFVRAYDKAGTERSTGNKTPDFTAGIKIAKDQDGYYYLIGDYHPEFKDTGEWSTDTDGRFCKKAGERDTIIQKQAEHDGSDVVIVFPVDPGQAGGSEFLTSSRELINLGYIVEKDPTASNKAKLTRFSPFANLAQNGFVRILKSSFSLDTYEALMKELESFDGMRSTGSRKDDWCDCISSGINYMEKHDIIRAVVMPKISAPTLLNARRR
jgi:phage terminase large subunit-like protein